MAQAVACLGTPERPLPFGESTETGGPGQIILTRTTEYRLCADLCVAVRDRRTGRWYVSHPALGSRFCGWHPAAGPYVSASGTPMLCVGDRASFATPDVHRYETDEIICIERPAE